MYARRIQNRARATFCSRPNKCTRIPLLIKGGRPDASGTRKACRNLWAFLVPVRTSWLDARKCNDYQDGRGECMRAEYRIARELKEGDPTQAGRERRAGIYGRRFWLKEDKKRSPPPFLSYSIFSFMSFLCLCEHLGLTRGNAMIIRTGGEFMGVGFG
jgi:hypothetical protein